MKATQMRFQWMVFFLIPTVLFWPACHPQPPGIVSDLQSLSLPLETEQILIVTVPSWDEYRGTLGLFFLSGDEWKMDSDPIPITVGRSGLAWGMGRHQPKSNGPQKIEGDGRAPAGIFELGTAYGYTREPPPGCIYPYRQATARDYFVDDTGSPDYNKWVSLADSSDTEPHHYWQSFERMRRDDDLYEWGVVVRHNMDPVRKGRGSAIFLHIWGGPDQPTAGCTAMSREEMLRVMDWLDPGKHPLLIQVPEEELKNMRLRPG